MALLNSIFTWFMKKRIHQIELFMKYPHDVQEEWFQILGDDDVISNNFVEEFYKNLEEVVS